MRSRSERQLAAVILSLSILGCSDNSLEPAKQTAPQSVAASSVASMYVANFVATAASGAAMNDAGDVVGTSRLDPGCGPFCLPPEEIVVWRGGTRTVLPSVPGFGSYQFPLAINAQGVIAGFAGYPGSTTHPAVWTPSGTGYTVQDLGLLPGMSSADVAGIDNQGRVVGWSSIGGAIPTATAPFMWSQATGMVNLAALGYPNERPVAISPGGAVATWNYWYQLGNPASAVLRPAAPRGFAGAGSNGTAINDVGDQALFLVSTSSQNLVYLFRLPNGGAWQQLSNFGTGRLSRAGIGSINLSRDVTGTIGSTGIIAPGPTGLAQNLGSLLSPAYGGAGISMVGPINKSGKILAQVMIGQSQRLMRLVPATPCTANCLQVSSLVLTGKFVQDPAHPGSCFQGGKMYNLTTATLTVTNEAGAKLGGVQVSGRFLDNYWTNRGVSKLTNASGVVKFSNKGPCGVGSVSFLTTNAKLGTRTFDQTKGTVAASVIPH